ncbi:hypothetical protein D3C81_1009950 [compost metagenome]
MQQLAEIRVLGAQGVVAIGQRRCGADFQVLALSLDALEFGDVADIDHHRQGLVELGDFQRQVGTTGQQACFGVRTVQVGQVGHGQRHQAALVAAVELTGFTRRDGLEAGDGLGFAAVELIRLGLAAGLLGGGQDRPVTGAAAEVAGQGFLGLVQIGCIAVLLQGEQ